MSAILEKIPLAILRLLSLGAALRWFVLFSLFRFQWFQKTQEHIAIGVPTITDADK
jgi:hypothetical protein